MAINVTLTEGRGGSAAAPFYALAVERVQFSGAILPAEGESVALLSLSGETLALGTVDAEGGATLDLNTVQADAETAFLIADNEIYAALVVGDTDNVRAVVRVQLGRNRLDNIAPPTESAPVYPTAAELQAILAEMAQKQTEVNDDFQAVQVLVDGFDEAVRKGEETINNTVSVGASAIANFTNEKTAEIAEAATAGATRVNTAATNAETALQTKVTEATESITQSTKAATDAATEAVEAQEGAETAQGKAEAAQEAAETALNNGCIYQVREVTDAAIALEKTLTAYKHTPTADTAYTFTAPADVAGKIIVFWLWIVMGETAHQLTFDSRITWLSEPSLAANTETMLAFMSVDGGATWQANVQWEVGA